MARQKTKNCIVCRQPFSGRPNAKTCSARCRKRLQRAKSLLSREIHEAETAEHKIEKWAEEVVKSLENRVGATATEEGFASVPMSAAPAVPVAPLSDLQGSTPQTVTPVTVSPPPLGQTTQPATISSQLPSSQPAGVMPTTPMFVARAQASTPASAVRPLSPTPSVIPLESLEPTARPAAPVLPVSQAASFSSISTTPLINQTPQTVVSQATPVVGPSPLHALIKRRYINMMAVIFLIGGLFFAGGIAYLISQEKKQNAQVSQAAYSSTVNVTNNTLQNLSSGSALTFNVNTTIGSGKTFTATGLVAIQNEADSTHAFTVQNAAGDNLIVADTQNQRVGIGTAPTGNATLQVSGNISAGGGATSLGNGGLTINNVLVCTATGCSASTLGGQPAGYYTNATNISTGTLSNARLSANVTLQGNTFNGASQLVQLNNSGDLPVLSGINLTNLNATQLTVGTVNNLRLSPNVTLQGNTFNGASQLIQTTNLAFYPALNGSLITNLNASNLASGTVNDNLLSSNVALLGASNQTFSGSNTFDNILSAPGLETTNSSHIIAVGFSGSATGGLNYNFDNSATPGTYTICTTFGNCSGSGGGVTTLGGTINKIPKFTGPQTLGDSLIYDNGTDVFVNQITGTYTLDVAGDINSTTGLRVGGNLVCDSSGCGASSGSGFYIQNGTGIQTGANYYIRSASTSAVTGVLEGASGQTADILDVQAFGGGTKYLAVGTTGASVSGNVNASGQYQVGGVQISSANLSNDTNLAKLSANQTFTGNNTFTGTFTIQPAVDSTSIAVFQNHAGNSNLLIADSTDTRIGIGMLPGYTLDVNGDINIATGSSFRINGVAICGPSATCAPSAGSSNYIQNTVGLQANANFNIESVNSSSVVGILRGASGQTADLLRGQDGLGNNVFIVDPSGNVNITGSYEVNGSPICTSGGCTPASGSSAYVQLQGSTPGVTQTGSTNISGTAISANVQTATLDQSASGALGIGQANATSIAIGNTSSNIATNITGTVLIKPSTGNDSTTAFQVQNAAGTTTLLGIDSVNNNITLGKLTAGALAAWSTSGNSLPTSRACGGYAYANGYVYILAGTTSTCTGSNGTNTVYYAKLNSDGSTGIWQTNANVLPQTLRDEPATVSANGYLYVTGGETNGGSAVSTVYYAKLNSDGSTGVWSTNANALPAVRQELTSASANGFIYALGGNDGSGSNAQSTVYYAKLNSDGSTGAWQTNANALPAVRQDATSVILGGYIYEMGGSDNSLTPQPTVYYAKLNSDGSTGAWSTNSNALPVATQCASTATINGYIYTLGNGLGNCTSTPASTVYYSKANSDGSTGTWSTNSHALPQTLNMAASIAVNGFVYEIGGFNGSTAQTTVYFASVQGMTRNSGQESISDQLTVGNGLTVKGGISLQALTDSTSAFSLQNATGGNLINVDSVNSIIALDGNTSGQLSSWATNANALPGSRNLASSVTANGYVYEIGGSDGSDKNTVLYAKLNADGSTGAWSTNANALPQVVRNSSSVTANGYVYTLGGIISNSYSPTIYYAKLNADGSTGVWNTNANSLPAARNLAGAIVANGYVYVIGGNNGSALQSTVYYAKLNADGSIGAWSTNTNALPQGLDEFTSVVVNGFVYTMGGCNTWNCGAPDQTSAVYYAKLNADGSTSTWTTSARPLPLALMDATSVTSNGYVYVIGGTNSSGTALSTVYYSKLNADGSNGPWNTNASSLPAARFLATSVLANGYVYVLGGPGLTTVYYASTARIQLGANLDLVGLQGGTLSDPGDQSTGSAGGSLTAGNGLFVGSLQVQGSASFAQGVGITGNLTNTGSALFQSSTGLTSAFQVQNTTGAQAINVSTVTTPNLISNGDFESGTSGWSGKGSGTIARNDTTAIGAASGVGSLAVTTTAAANDGAFFNYTFAASTQYTLSLYARSTSGTVSTISIGHQDVATTDINCLTSQSITTTWTRYTCTFTTGGTITPPTQIYIKQSDATARTFYIDAVQLEQASSASSFQANQANFQVQTSTSAITLDGSNSGALGSWTTSASSLPAVRDRATSVTSNGYIYEIGGVDNTNNANSTVYYAKANSDGSIGSWTTNANPLPDVRRNASSVVANGYVYEIGGCQTGCGGGGSTTSTVYYAKLNPDGSTGVWQTSPNTLLSPRFGTSAAVANGYVYLLGGLDDTLTARATVYYAKLNADGSIGAWQTSANALPSALSFASTVVANGYIYEIGGQLGADQNSVYYSKLNADGSIGSWQTNTNTLPASQALHTSVVSNGYVYVIGGDGGTNGTTTIYYAKLNSDGSTGAWSTNTNSLPEGREFATSVIANGYVYEIGGLLSATFKSTVFYASASRIQIGANLDLVGLQGGTLSDPGDQSFGSVGGSLTAGNGLFVGSLQVQGQGNFAQGLQANGNLTIGGSALFQNAADSTVAFQIQNAAGKNFLLVDTTNTTVYIGITGSANVNSTVHIADSSAGVQTITIGSTSSSSAVAIQAGTGDITLTGHIKSTGTAPSAGTPTNCGTGSPSAAVTAGSSDSAGSFTITAGTGSPATCDTVITFNATYTTAPKSVVITPTLAVGSATNQREAYVSAINATTFTIKINTNLTGNTPAAGEVMSFYYWVIK